MVENVDGLLLDTSSPVASVTFNRPDKANYVDYNWFGPLKHFFEEVRSKRSIRCVVIKSTGKYFSAGGDLNRDVETLAMTPEARLGSEVDIGSRYNEMMSALLAVPQPIVASVQGGVVGGTIGLVVACDLVIAAESAFFTVAQVNIGLAVSGLITYYLPRQIGYKKTMHLCLLGERVLSREAERLGLVSLVVPNDQLQAETEKLVNRLATGPTIAYGFIKELVMSSFDHSCQEQGMLETLSVSNSALTRDYAEGIDAIMKKRKPTFIGE